MFTQSDELATELSSASKKAREQVWRMPLPDAYEEQIKSKIADLVNVGPRAGGAITAALFLGHFVDDVPHAHVDVCVEIKQCVSVASMAWRSTRRFSTKAP